MPDDRRGRLAGKVALISGTGGGQGRAAALLFASEGATVVGCDIDTQSAGETAELVRRGGGVFHYSAPVDLGDSRQATAWVDSAASDCGGLDIVYNNAGSLRMGPIGEFSDDDWHYTIRNELDHVFFVCRAAWRHLVARGRGAIINTASVCGLSAIPIVNGDAFAHAATKGGVIAMTRELAVAGGSHGIRANSLSPGPVEVPSTAPLLVDALADWNLSLPRFGQPQDIAQAALFLASDESSWITGANIVVDGGFTGR